MELNKSKNLFFKLLTKTKSNFLKIGFVSKPHHIKGELFIRPFHEESQLPSGLDKLFLGKNLEGKALTRLSKHKQGWIVKLEDINSRNEAEAFKGCDVFVWRQDLKSEQGEYIYISELLDFSVWNQDQCLGKITSFSSVKFQDYLHVKKESKSFLIPLVKSYIKLVDFQKQKLCLELPENFLNTFHD